MITIIFGAPGSGKSSLSTYFLKQLYRTEGEKRQRGAQAEIARINETRLRPLTAPDKPPIFANYRVKFKTGYEKWFEMPTQFIPPYSGVFLGEAQRFFNSRKSKTLPDWVSRFFEMHRHYHVDLWLDVQRPILIDANIRELCKLFIEVRKMVHVYDAAGRITSTTFHVREFERWGAVEQYLNMGGKEYEERTYTNEGNIFRAFDSYSYFSEFLPAEGRDFSMLPFGGKGTFYETSEPKEYRRTEK